jgi:hypothetical protein
MNKITWFGLSLVIVIAMLFTSCGTKPTPTTTSVTTQTTKTTTLAKTTTVSTTATTTTTTPKTTTTTTTPPIIKTSITTATNKVIFKDNFDSETAGSNPSNWTVIEPSGTDISIDDEVYFGTGGKSMKMQDNSDSSLPQLYKVIGSQTGTFCHEASVRCAQTNVIEGVLYISNSVAPGGSSGLEGIGVSITFWSDGYIKYIVSGVPYVWANIQAYEANKWYTVKVFVDVPNQKYDIYLDGVLKVSGVNFRFPLSSLDEISFVARVEPPSSTMWIDNVLVTEAP